MSLLHICGFCRKEIEPDTQTSSTSSATISFSICTECLTSIVPFDHDDLTKFEREAVDSLPYGTILLDKDNTVLLYNAAESAMTGLLPSEIEGKNFFVDVAPCTAVKEFKGKIDIMRELGRDGQENLQFTFNHNKFYAYVDILATYFSNTEIVVISVQKLD